MGERFILDSDSPMGPPLSAIDYWAEGDSDYDEEDDDYDYDDDDGDVEYDKNGRRFWRKKEKDKGDDRSKAIHWRKHFPKFDYDRLNEKQELLCARKYDVSPPLRLSEKHSIANANNVFESVFARRPGWYGKCVYVRNETDCDYYCRRLLESPIMPGVIGVDIEMENDSCPFRDWHSKWRTIRAHSRLAKGMFARTLQAANCSGLVVVFDLYALARPHCWNGGIECDAIVAIAASGRRLPLPWQHRRVPLPTSSLPPSLVRFILDPNIVRFGWALHCDWSSLYNSFGLLVPQSSYLDAQSPWRYELSDTLRHRGNGLADAARALFGVNLDKSLRGYGHFWHGGPPNGVIPWRLVQYAAIDAQTSLDVALYIAVRTKWLRDWRNVWSSANVQSDPMPGVRKRVRALYGLTDDDREACAGESVSADDGYSSTSTLGSGLGAEAVGGDPEIENSNRSENEGELSQVSSGNIQEEEEEIEDGADVKEEMECDELDEDGEQTTTTHVQEVDSKERQTIEVEEAADHTALERAVIADNLQITISGSNRLIRGTAATNNNEEESESGVAHFRRIVESTDDFEDDDDDDNEAWRNIPISARKFIIKTKFEALKIFGRIIRGGGGGDGRDRIIRRSAVDGWTLCPAFMVLRGVKHHALKRIIFAECASRNASSLWQTRALYRHARRLCDSNLDWAWRKASSESNGGPRCLSRECEIFRNRNLKRMMLLSSLRMSAKHEEPSSSSADTAFDSGVASGHIEAPHCGKKASALLPLNSIVLATLHQT